MLVSLLVCGVVSVTCCLCLYPCLCVQLSSADPEVEVKPPSNEEDPVVRPSPDEEEPYYKGEDVARFKSKKPADSDDDEDEEPPPPYTTYDPQEEKTEEKKDSARRPSLRDQEGGRGERRDASPGCNESVHEKDEARKPSGTVLLQRHHSKLIPEPSLGFQILTTPTLESDGVLGLGPGDLEHTRIQNEHQESERVGMLSKDRSGSDSGSTLPSHISSPSPEIGLTLPEMTMITTEDGSRVKVLDAKMAAMAIGLSTDTATITTTTTATTSCASLGESCREVGMVTSKSCTPLENSLFQSELPNIPVSSTSSVSVSSTEQQQQQPCGITLPITSSSSSSSSSSSGLKLSSFLPKAKGRSKKLEKSSKATNSGSSSKPSKEKGQKKNKDKSSLPASVAAHGSHKQLQQPSSHSPKGPVSIPPPNSSSALDSLKVRPTVSGQPLGNSQESFMDGLSPELSDCGDHSSEIDSSPREAHILRAGYNLGMSVDMDFKINCVVVKAVSSSGAVGRDGRIRVGDRIEAVNGKSLAGQNLARAKLALKRAAKGDEFTITYSPALVPPPHPHFTPFPPITSSLAPSSTYDKSTTMSSKMSQQKHETYYPLPSMVASLHDQEPASRQTQGASNIHLPPQGGAGAGVMPTHMIQQVQSSLQSWKMDGSSVSSAYHHIQPQQQSYYNQMAIEDQMGKPPPPYLYPHQAPPPPVPTTKGRMIGGQSPYSHIVGGNQVPTPPPAMPWQQQLPHPQGNSCCHMI